MASRMYIIAFLVFLSVHCFALSEGNKGLFNQKLKRSIQIPQTRFKRENPVLGRRGSVRAVQPNVVVMPSVPNTYAAVPSSSYGVNRAPTVVVSMPNDVYNTPVVANPYGVPTRL